MDFKEAILVARARQIAEKRPIVVTSHGSDYQVEAVELPDNAAMIVLSSGHLEFLSPEALARYEEILKRVIQGQPVRVPGKNVRRRSA